MMDTGRDIGTVSPRYVNDEAKFDLGSGIWDVLGSAQDAGVCWLNSTGTCLEGVEI